MPVPICKKFFKYMGTIYSESATIKIDLLYEKQKENNFKKTSQRENF